MHAIKHFCVVNCDKTSAVKSDAFFQELLYVIYCSFDSLLLYVHKNQETYQGRGAQDGHLDFCIAPKLSDFLLQHFDHDLYFKGGTPSEDGSWLKSSKIFNDFHLQVL